MAGCVSTPRQNAANVSDWQDLDTSSLSTVSPVPAITAVPTPINPLALPAKGPVPDETEPGNRARGTWVPLPEWTRSRGLATPALLSSGLPVTYAVKSTNGLFVIKAGSVLGHWDGLELRLGYAPQWINGQLYVHALDLRKTLQPLLQSAPGTNLGIGSVIVLDPGHGGTDVGTKSVRNGYFEKDYTLDWALRLQALLTAHGYRVFLTRHYDTEVALSNRVAFAAQHKADAFISLHFNSAGQDSNEVGLETYCLTPAGMPSSITRGFSDETSLIFTNNAYDAQNLRLALKVHRALLQVNGHLDRGVRRARFPGVLRGQDRPAILVEGGYLSNPREAGLIADPDYRQRLAEAVARALAPSSAIPSQIAKREAQAPPERMELRTSSADKGSADVQEPVGITNGQPP